MNLYVALSQDHFNLPNPAAEDGGFINCLKGAIKYILSFTKIPYGVLLGGVRKKWDRYYFLITMEKLKRIKWSINEQLKNEFLSSAVKYFEKDGFNQFKVVLSDKFFINPFKIVRLPNVFYGAPDNLFKEEFCHLLFIDQKLNFIGLQHGGCTKEYAENKFDDYDQNISDKMLHWGFGKINIRQNRFVINRTPFQKIKKLHLIESLKPNLILNNFFSGSKEIYVQAEKKRDSIVNYIRTGIIKHPRSIETNYHSFTEAVLFSDIPNNDIKSNLYIVDVPFQTFIYKAIYENLPFLMFINREWHKWFTRNYSNFLKFCNEQKVLFYWDEEEEFILYIKEIMIKKVMDRVDNKDLMKYLGRNLK